MALNPGDFDLVRNGFRPEAGPRVEGTAKDFFREKGLPIDIDDLRRGFPAAGNPFEAIRPGQVPPTLAEDDRDLLAFLLLGLWNHTPFEALGGRTPAQALDAGDAPEGGPAALGTSLARCLGVHPGARPTPLLEKMGSRKIIRAEDWLFAHLLCLGSSPYQLLERMRIPPVPDPSDLPPPGRALRTFEEDAALLGNDNFDIRHCAALRVALSRDPRARHAMLRLLEDRDSPIVRVALGSLRDSGAREARETVLRHLEEWEDLDASLVGDALDLLAAAGATDDLRSLIGRLEEDREPTWLPHALPGMDEAMRAEASANLLGTAGAGRSALRTWPWILGIGIRDDVREITRRCLEDLRRARLRSVPFEAMAVALDLDRYLHEDLARSLRPGRPSVPIDEAGDDSGLVPIEPDPAVLAGICRLLGPLGERFLSIHDPAQAGVALAEAGAWLAEAAGAAAARNPAFAREAARLAGLGEALAETRSRPLDGDPKADGLLALCLLLLVRATEGRSSREEIPLLGPDPSPEALLGLHRGETVSPAPDLVEPLARRVAPETLVESLSSESLPVAFRAARALVAGHGERYLPSLEPLLARSTSPAVEFLDWTRPLLGEAAVLPAARLFRRAPDIGTADLLARTCAVAATERSREIFLRHEPHLIRLGDPWDLGLHVLVLGDRRSAEVYLEGVVAETEEKGFDAWRQDEETLRAIGILHGLEDRAGAVIDRIREFRPEEEDGDGDGSILDSDPFERPPSPQPPVETIRREAPKTGRNDPCPCGSGKKFKKCCGRK